MERAIPGVLPAINTIDKLINKCHGTNLVQHRYRVEKNVILIVDECHRALSSRGADKPMTENLCTFAFDKERENYGNILVSATPWLAKEYKQLARVTSKFLCRTYHDDEEYNQENILKDFEKDIYSIIT